jgi:organic hydroperoxide reductase OsmC/OhrA
MSRAAPENSPMREEHHYSVKVKWTGNTGKGTNDYRSYNRDHVIGVAGKLPIAGSADPKFRGNAARYNPEELLVASLSACHMLWYLHLCADSGVVVVAYEDEPEGIMETSADGNGRFVRVTLRPRVHINKGSAEKAKTLHRRAHELCFIANSVNFPVAHEATVEINV